MSRPAKNAAAPPAGPKPLPQPACEDGAHSRRRKAYAARLAFGEERESAYAALDLGTNNCRLLVAVPGRPGRFRVVDAFSRIVRLGEGLAASGRLGEAAMDRAVAALAVCAQKLDGRRLAGLRMIATEACRTAENGACFIERVYRETGLKLDVIDRRTEARLAVSGCSSLVSRDTEGLVLFDIGGGSSEIALVDLSRRRTPRTVQRAPRAGGKSRHPGQRLDDVVNTDVGLPSKHAAVKPARGVAYVVQQRHEAGGRSVGRTFCWPKDDRR